MRTDNEISKKVLQIGPDPVKSRGGMATVINDIVNDNMFKPQFEMVTFPSYRDGNVLYRVIYCIFAYLRFLLIYKKYDIFHIHIASYTSTFRKTFYIRKLKRSNKKVICHIHGGGFLKFYEKLKPQKKKKISETLNSADLVIALSDGWRDQIQSKCEINDCISISNGIPTEPFLKAFSKIDLHKHSFVFLGKICKEKGVYDLIEAVQRMVPEAPEIKLYLAGDGEIEKADYMIKAKGLEKNIELVGWVDFDGKINLLRKCSTLILPSYNEGLPMVLLEGMAAGKICIASDVGAIPELIKPDNGFLIAPGDIEGLTSAMKKCYEAGEQMECIAENNLEKATSEYSLKVMHRKIKEAYELLISD